MQIQVIGENNKPVEALKETSREQTTIEGGSPEEMETKAIGQVLGLETLSQINKYSDNLRTLLSYAKSQTKNHSLESLKWTIRSLGEKLGTPSFAEDRIKYITRYAWFSNEERRIQEEKKKFERNL